METATNFWWLKNKAPVEIASNDITSTNKSDEISSSLREFLEKERALENSEDVDTDIGSIIEEINKVAAQSPLGPFEKYDERSFEEIMKEVEQLSARSRTSVNLSTPTPKSASPLPLDYEKENSEDDEEYTEDFEEKSEPQTPSANQTSSNQIKFNSGDNNEEVKQLENKIIDSHKMAAVGQGLQPHKLGLSFMVLVVKLNA
ncbi:hypothetical protein FQR65_LT01408 [Abscondita terminalis]|nr:hypothetical protein FQR65_LT01408 [Abscondita terminalis]